MNNRLTDAAAKRLERKWALEHEAVHLLDVISAEFKSDPQSRQCFDSRIADRAIEVSRELRDLEGYF